MFFCFSLLFEFINFKNSLILKDFGVYVILLNVYYVLKGCMRFFWVLYLYLLYKIEEILLLFNIYVECIVFLYDGEVV